MKKQALIMIGAVVLVLGVGIYLASRDSSVNSTSDAAIPAADMHLLENSGSHLLGSANAKVQLVEFGDYECPSCGEIYPVLKQITDKYGSNKDFGFVFRNFPLAQHANAMIAAEAAEAAGAQGKYWQMHDLLYEKQNDWAALSNPLNVFSGYAQSIGLDVGEFQKDVQANRFANNINADSQDGLSLQVDATPTLFLNGQRIVGFTSFVDLDGQISELLKK